MFMAQMVNCRLFSYSSYGERRIKNLEISYVEDWQKLHWKSIKIAYQSSPYFEYYEDKLKRFSRHPKLLLAFNLNAIK
jgi:hypothetical protein